MLNRRSFLSGLMATTAGLYLPYEPQRIYSFASSKYIQVVRMTKRLIETGRLIPESEGNQIHLAMSTWDKLHIDFMSRNLAHTNLGPAVLWIEPYINPNNRALGRTIELIGPSFPIICVRK